MNIDDELWYAPVRELLVARRQQLGLTQAEVCQRSGIDPASISRLEHGISRYGKDGRLRLAGPITIGRWASALRVDASLVFTLNAPEWRGPFTVDVMDLYRF